MSRSSVLASLASQDVSASEFDKLDADNGSDYQSQVDLKSPLASPTFTGSITTPEIRSGATLTIDPATVGDNTGVVLLKGNLQVDGLTTTINSETLTVDDKNIVLASGASDSANADGAGITIDGASATMLYTHSTTSFDFNKPVNVTGDVRIKGDAGTLNFYRTTSPADIASIEYNHSDSTLKFWAKNKAINFSSADADQDAPHLYIEGTTGKVGIGATPSEMLDIVSSATTCYIQLTNDDNANNWIGLNGSTMRFFNNNINTMTFDNTGNVGIKTADPVGDLHISESGASEVRFQLTNSNTGHAGSDGFAIVLDAAASNQYFWNYEARNMIFGTGGSTRMTIDDSGNVGIGGVYTGFTPTFSVEGTQPAIGAYKDATNFVNTIVNSGVVKTLYDDSAKYQIGKAANRGGTSEATQIQIENYTVTDSNIACRTSLGWGATDDLQSCVFQVNSHRYYTQGAVFKDRDGSTSYAGTLLQFYRQSNSVGSITTVNGTISLNGTSDYRLKYDIQDINSGLEVISKLKPRTFKWLVNKDTKRDDGTKYDNPDVYGFIAHEVQEAIPRATDLGIVQGEKDGEDYQSMDDTKLNPLIIKAIQELSAKVTALENAS